MRKRIRVTVQVDINQEIELINKEIALNESIKRIKKKIFGMDVKAYMDKYDVSWEIAKRTLIAFGPIDKSNPEDIAYVINLIKNI